MIYGSAAVISAKDEVLEKTRKEEIASYIWTALYNVVFFFEHGS